MRVLLMANNWGGLQITKWLREQGENIVGLVLHPAKRSKFGLEILMAAQMPRDGLINAATLRDECTIAAVQAMQPDIGVSAFLGYILKPEIFNIPRLGCVNLHPAFLPYNRGLYSNVYPFFDGSPVGVTVHYINEGIDTGDIIARRRAAIRPFDTGGTLHQRLTKQLVELFKDAWPVIKAGGGPLGFPQPYGHFGARLGQEMEKLERIDLDKEYTARYLLGLLRGLTYPPYPAAYYEDDGRRIYVRVELFGEEDKGTPPEWGPE